LIDVSIDNASVIYLSLHMRLRQSRMRRSRYFVLAALADGPLHGWAIIKDAELMSDGQVRLATGRLFAVLDWLTGQGLVIRAGERLVAGQPRPCYALTQSGRTSLHAQVPRRVVMAGLLAHAGDGTRIGRIVSVGGRVRIGSSGDSRDCE
jgi:PadR family transcriptional regulator, regulatory protein PadR